MLPTLLQPGSFFPPIGTLVEQAEDLAMKSSVSRSAAAVCRLCCSNRGGWRHPHTQSPTNFPSEQKKKN